MIRRPPRSTQSRSSAASDVYKRQDGNAVRQVNCAGDELSLFIYDHVDQLHTSTVDNNYYDCVDDTSTPMELLYPPSQHSSQLQHAPQQKQQQQQQQCGRDGDEDATVKLQLLTGCGNKTALEYPWMRDKKCTSDVMCMSTSLSDRRLKQCLTSDPLTKTSGLSVHSCVNLLSAV